ATNNQIQTELLNITSMSRDPVVSREIVYSSRCLTNLQQQKYPAALASCRQAVKINPDNTEAHLNLGLTHFRLEQYQQSIANKLSKDFLCQIVLNFNQRYDYPLIDNLS
ncbi:MAG: tetratricopeptide repeat protein, partial [Cyanobacteria bacterium J06629_2]